MQFKMAVLARGDNPPFHIAPAVELLLHRLIEKTVLVAAVALGHEQRHIRAVVEFDCGIAVNRCQRDADTDRWLHLVFQPVDGFWLALKA